MQHPIIPSAADIAAQIRLRHPDADPDTVNRQAAATAKLIAAMHDADAEFSYRKVSDGSIRRTRGTLLLWLWDIPEPATPAPLDGLIRYWDFTAKPEPGWRSFDPMNLIVSAPQPVSA